MLEGQNEGLLFGVFAVIIVIFLIVDLGFFHKKSEKVSQGEALRQSLFWVGVSIGYGMLIYYFGEGPAATWEYFSAYVTEKALSIDNIFVIILILKFFQVKEEYYHGILFWGIFMSDRFPSDLHFCWGDFDNTVSLDPLHFRSFPYLFRCSDI